eukprot:FR736153.1.p1 GENE.FR736153.1~~FR736153.1.p1  ORF type:complete len:253 (+),score=4.65 FR736153.1:123-881(+)
MAEAEEPPACDEPAEPDLVGTPNATSEGAVGCGDPERVLFLPGSEFAGAHTNNPSYFSRSDGNLQLKSVCWLAVGGTIKNVPAGAWEPVLRVRVDCSRDSPTFVADWRVGVGVGHVRDWPASEADAPFTSHCVRVEEKTGVRPLIFRNTQGRGGAGSKLLREHSGKFIKLSFGELRLHSTSDVRFEMGGGSPSWANGLCFTMFELRAVGLRWPQKRLLILCQQRKAWVGELPPAEPPTVDTHHHCFVPAYRL